MQVEVAPSNGQMTGRPGSDFRRTWHSDSDADTRRRVLSDMCVPFLLRGDAVAVSAALHSNSPVLCRYTTLTLQPPAPEHLTKVQGLAKRLEVSLYRSAQSLVRSEVASSMLPVLLAS
jgi:hypothetical protein